MFESAMINGIKLTFSISHLKPDQPLVLYLHGGPGFSCAPLMQKFNSRLDQDLNFINLEQRGTGLSYYPFAKDEKITISTFIDDVYQFVCYLLDRYQRKQLILVGHSWGSILGLKFIEHYPELISKYIGVGQVINTQKNLDLQREFLTGKIKDTDLKKDSIYLTRKIVKHGGSLYQQTNEAKLIRPFITSGVYSFGTLINFLKGSKQTVNALWDEVMQVNFEDVKEYSVPVYFFEGKHDHHVPSSLVDNYAKTLQSPASVVWFESSGHYPQWEEPDKFNDQLIKICT
ncbi:alpha/beta fold hydrolase [Xylocopilactobacillus apicola]|uniref:Alpha/beta hydrolase n=1 Tax=Xylocopilactobacillus apicola TaxID=2932184 RepID=A0AAU9DI90_9LACO|nr:alpha/beta hydrolase [Xylocopilactobacillus apicola]BDR58066.1 alpha/beta hydrolase [Xylocopilactobacillus apicola]